MASRDRWLTPGGSSAPDLGLWPGGEASVKQRETVHAWVNVGVYVGRVCGRVTGVCSRALAPTRPLRQARGILSCEQ